MTYKQLLNKLQKFSPEELKQEVLAELNTTDFGDWLIKDFKEFKKVDEYNEYPDKIGQIYLG